MKITETIVSDSSIQCPLCWSNTDVQTVLLIDEPSTILKGKIVTPVKVNDSKIKCRACDWEILLETLGECIGREDDFFKPLKEDESWCEDCSGKVKVSVVWSPHGSITSCSECYGILMADGLGADAMMDEVTNVKLTNKKQFLDGIIINFGKKHRELELAGDNKENE